MLILVAALFLSTQIYGFPTNGVEIIGGKLAKEGQFPFAATVLHNNQVCCGGLIVHKKFILSSHECLSSEKESTSFSVGVGSVNTLKQKKIPVKKIYTPEKNENNVALAQLKKPIIFNDRTQAIELIDEEPEVGLETIAMGWGNTKPSEIYESAKATKRLRYLPEKIIDCPKSCFKSDTEICSGEKEGNGLGDGDSGSPLVTLENNNTYLAVGIALEASHSKLKDQEGADLYISVHQYKSWINQIIENQEDEEENDEFEEYEEVEEYEDEGEERKI